MRTRGTWITIGSAAVGVAVVATVLWLTLKPAPTHALQGSIDITNCASIGGYDNVGPGDEVVVSDSAGEIVATSELGPAPAGGVGENCTYNFTVDDVPGGSDFYTLEVGDLDGVTVREDELSNVTMSD